MARTPNSAALMLALATLLIWPFGGGKQERLTPTAQAPGSAGIATINRDRNGNTIIKLEVKYLAPATMLHPPQVCYVVWAQPTGRPPENKGVLRAGGNREADLTFPVPYSTFLLFITAESNPLVTEPSEQIALSGQITP